MICFSHEMLALIVIGSVVSTLALVRVARLLTRAFKSKKPPKMQRPNNLY